MKVRQARDGVGPDADALQTGLDAIRAEFKVPGPFPAEVLAAAEEAAARVPGRDHVDRTDMPFVTLDPATATDLDQAFAIEVAGRDLVLRYAIADVGFFVDPDGDLDRGGMAPRRHDLPAGPARRRCTRRR